nr:hypothetical protein [Herbaspirillum sp. ASV7]
MAQQENHDDAVSKQEKGPVRWLIFFFDLAIALRPLIFFLILCITVLACVFPLVAHVGKLMLNGLQGLPPPELTRTALMFFSLGGIAGACVLRIVLIFEVFNSEPDPIVQHSVYEKPVPSEEFEGWDGFDQDDPKYPEQLDIAFQAWRAITVTPGKGTVKEQLAAWIKVNYPKQSASSIDRIVTICNWDKTGGRPKQS